VLSAITSSAIRLPASSRGVPSSTRPFAAANRHGDQLVVTKLDRLGRSLEHLIEISTQLQARGVDLVVLDQGIDTSTAVGRMFFHILGAIAEFEHALMSERTIDGLAAARARGRTGGQKPTLGPRQVKLAREIYDETDEDGKRKHTVLQIAAEFGVSRPTIYRHLTKDDGLSRRALTALFVPAFPSADVGPRRVLPSATPCDESRAVGSNARTREESDAAQSRLLRSRIP
jgi:AraC-like DNA-binding protein